MAFIIENVLFDVGSLVVVPKELATTELIKVEHLAPKFWPFPGRIQLERNVRNCTGGHNCFQIAAANVSLVSRKFGYLKSLRSSLQKGRKVTGNRSNRGR